MILLCRLYGKRDCSQFSKAQLPLAYYVVMWGRSFNWGGIISKQLSLNFAQAESPKHGDPTSFHMVSFLLDVLCAQNTFPGLYLFGKSLRYMSTCILIYSRKIGTRSFILKFVTFSHQGFIFSSLDKSVPCYPNKQRRFLIA
jgi:hypothetical protein